MLNVAYSTLVIVILILLMIGVSTPDSVRWAGPGDLSGAVAAIKPVALGQSE